MGDEEGRREQVRRNKEEVEKWRGGRVRERERQLRRGGRGWGYIVLKLFTLCLDMQLYTMRACISIRRYFQLNSTKMLLPFFVHKFAFKLANIFKYFTTTLIGINILLIICMERKQT